MTSILLMAANDISNIPESVRNVLEPLFLILMAAVAVATVVLILMQKPVTGGGMGAIDGSDSVDTYMGKNKGRSKEAKLKIATLVMLGALLLISITYFVIRIL